MACGLSLENKNKAFVFKKCTKKVDPCIMEIYRSVGGSARYEMFQSFQVLNSGLNFAILKYIM